jgi:hypothetical protein
VTQETSRSVSAKFSADTPKATLCPFDARDLGRLCMYDDFERAHRNLAGKHNDGESVVEFFDFVGG